MQRPVRGGSLVEWEAEQRALTERLRKLYDTRFDLPITGAHESSTDYVARKVREEEQAAEKQRVLRCDSWRTLRGESSPRHGTHTARGSSPRGSSPRASPPRAPSPRAPSPQLPQPPARKSAPSPRTPRGMLASVPTPRTAWRSGRSSRSSSSSGLPRRALSWEGSTELGSASAVAPQPQQQQVRESIGAASMVEASGPANADDAALATTRLRCDDGAGVPSRSDGAAEGGASVLDGEAAPVEKKAAPVDADAAEARGEAALVAGEAAPAEVARVEASLHGWLFAPVLSCMKWAEERARERAAAEMAAEAEAIALADLAASAATAALLAELIDGGVGKAAVQARREWALRQREAQIAAVPPGRAATIAAALNRAHAPQDVPNSPP